MKNILKDYVALILVLVIFIIIKIPHLSYPYYWDESWPYATAINSLYEHGISLMPNAIDAEVSRGHPLLSHAMAVMWRGVFGNSYVAMHSFALFISLVFIIVLYSATLRIFGRREAILALALVVLQELFIVQASMVLLEMLVALLCFLALWSYVSRRYMLTALWLIMLFFTKESGMMMGFVLGIDAWIAIPDRRADRKDAIGRLMSVAVPTAVIGGYFLLQRYLQGWFIFPFYSESLPHTWEGYWYKFRIGAIQGELYTYFKYWYYFMLGGLIVAVAVVKRRWAWLIYLVPVILCYYFVDDKRAGRLLPGPVLFILFIATWLYLIYLFFRLFDDFRQRRFIILGGCFVLAFLVFTGANFYTYRYMLASLIPMFVIVAAMVVKYADMLWKGLYYVYLTGVVIVAWCAFSFIEGHGDGDLAAFSAMEVELAVISYMEENGYHDRHVASGPFMQVVHLLDPATGFLKKKVPFKHVKWTIDDSTDFIIFNNIEDDYRYESVKQDKHFNLVYRKEKDGVWSEVYERRHD